MTVVDLRPQLPPIRDQGLIRGTCLAFATTTAHETSRGAGNGDRATEVLFWAAKEVEGNREDGTTFRAVYHALKDHGQPDEAAWPYDPGLDISDPSYGPPGGGFVADDCERARLRKVPNDLAAIRAELDAGNVVVVGIEMWEEFEVLKTGELELPAPGGLSGDYHAVGIVGYEDNAKRLLVRNSWGEDWGDAGYAWLPDELVLLVVTAAAVEQLL
jgi:C1A family cysteine protease